VIAVAGEVANLTQSPTATGTTAPRCTPHSILKYTMSVGRKGALLQISNIAWTEFGSQSG
jgi:hypothetical protein